MVTKERLIEHSENLSIRQQCEMLGLNRSSYYYSKRPEFSSEDLEILNRIDELYTEDPHYGYRRQYHQLIAEKYKIGMDRVRKYMRILDLKTLYPQSTSTSRPNKMHKIYPYLLKMLNINCPNVVWALDITYIRLVGGFCYLVAVIDWYSRYILSWRLSNSLERWFCLETLDEAIRNYSKAEVVNTDQGAQFTSTDFTEMVESNGIKMSMDSMGRWADNIIIERWFRTLKYEHIYMMDYRTMGDTKKGLSSFIDYYNSKRLHSALGYKTPRQVYFGSYSKEAGA